MPLKKFLAGICSRVSACLPQNMQSLLIPNYKHSDIVQIMTIDDFLAKFVKGYLLHDLESMAQISLPPGQNDGVVGYPMIATVLAGMELLGWILSPGNIVFDPAGGSNGYFLNFWNNYFTKQYPQYSNLGRLFRKLMRNGIAHNFVAKSGIIVQKGSGQIVSIDSARQEIYIDCIVFYKEFEDTYHKLVEPIVNNLASSSLTTKKDMQQRLDDLSLNYSSEAQRLFGGLINLHTSLIDVGKRSSVSMSSFSSNIHAANASLSIPYHLASATVSPFTQSVSTSGTITTNSPPII